MYLSTYFECFMIYMLVSLILIPTLEVLIIKVSWRILNRGGELLNQAGKQNENKNIFIKLCPLFLTRTN